MVTTTIQRLYSILRGEAALDPELEHVSLGATLREVAAQVVRVCRDDALACALAASARALAKRLTIGRSWASRSGRCTSASPADLGPA